MQGKQLKYEAGEFLIRQGEENPDRAFMITSGRCEIFVENEGKRTHIANAAPYQIVGEIALIDQSPRTANVVALEDTTVECMDRATFNACMKDSNPFVVALLRVLSGRYRTLIQKLDIKDLF